MAYRTALHLWAAAVVAAVLVVLGAGAPLHAATAGPVLVVVAHPDDEALGAAGVIERERAAGRTVVVAIVTNGDAAYGGGDSGYCGATGGTPSSTAHYGLTRDKETVTGMGILGLPWSTTVGNTSIFFLGYPDGALASIAASNSLYTSDVTGLHHTYAEDGDLSTATCNGDLHYLVTGAHADLTAANLAADMDTLLALVHPVDIYTHLATDGHPDHATVYAQVLAAVRRAGLSVTIHSMLLHPEGVGGCMYLSAYQWPNPADAGNPFSRFTPSLDVTAPPTPACSSSPTGTSWGTAGPPNELLPVPADMQATTESANRKWQVISSYASQINCVLRSDGTYHPSCGYMRAFVKAHEFFWTQQINASGSVPVSSGLPVVSGSAVVGQTLSASSGSWSGSPSSFAYQWQSCDSAGAGCAAVSGATGSSYVVAAGDLGRTLRVAVTATNGVGSSVPAVSALTAPVSGPSSSGVLGQSAVGALEDMGAAGYLDVSGPYALGQAASVSTLRAWVAGGSAVSRLRLVIYGSSGGQPSGLVAVSPEVSVAAGRPAGWLDVSLSSSVSLPAGSYWLGFWYADGNAGHFYSDASGAERYRVAAYSATGAPPSSFGSASSSTSSYALYAITTP